MDQIIHKLNPKLWVKQYSDLLFQYAFVRVNDREIAKDLVQESFLAALRNVNTYRGEISEKNWLFTILKNKIIDHYRKKSTSIFEKLETLSNVESESFDEKEHWIVKNAPQEWNIDYNKKYDSKEFFEVLKRCMNLLSELLRIVFSMKYLDEMDSEEICKELKISSSNYWVIIHRSKLQIRKCLEKNWFTK